MRGMKRVGRVAAIAAAALALGGLGVAVAGTNNPSSNASNIPGRGINEFGMTAANYDGVSLPFTYTKGFFCDTSVASTASSKCEAGANYNSLPPAANHTDPLYITVPLGFTVPMNMLQCPDTLVCVDHPGTIDLTRLEPALKPLYPSLTDAQLTAALANFAVPGHDHFIDDTNRGKAEWWPVKIVGVTSAATYTQIQSHKSLSYIEHLVRAKDPTVVGPIDTNLFLYFAVS
jgi:hypothetical protein